MRSHKPYRNATFTKRVDHEAGRHRPPRARKEPAVCGECGAVYAGRRWTRPGNRSDATTHWRPAHNTTCPACLQQLAVEPRGFVFVDGEFFAAHRDEIEKLLRNEAERAAVDNPLARILEWQSEQDHKLTLATTTEHLAQRLGHALEKAYGGRTHYDFSHENKLARVTWQR